MTKRHTFLQHGPRARCATRRRGISVAWTAVMMMAFIAITGLAIDTGHVWLVSQQLQHAADAAALAGAQKVWLDETGDLARQAARDVAQANRAGGEAVALADGDVVLGYWNRFVDPPEFDSASPYPNAVQVVARRTTPLHFGKIANVNTVDIERRAIAAIQNAGAAFYALSPDASPGVLFQGNITFNTINGGGIVNSGARNSVKTNGNPDLQIPQIEINPDSAPNARYRNFVPTAPKPDPILEAGVPEVDVDDLIARGLTPETWPANGVVTTATRQLGSYHYFPNGYTGGDLTLSPGIYILGGAGMRATVGRIQANGVMFYIRSGSIDLGGNFSIEQTPPKIGDFPEASTYFGISFWQPYGNHNQVSMHGTGTFDIDGVIYVPDAPFYVRGGKDSLGSQLIAETIDVGGTGTITINYRQRGAELAHQSYLVR